MSLRAKDFQGPYIMDRYNKSPVPENAEKYFYESPRESNSQPRLHRLALHYPSPLPTALSRKPQIGLFE